MKTELGYPYTYQPFAPDDKRTFGELQRIYAVVGVGKQPTVSGLTKEEAGALKFYYEQKAEDERIDEILRHVSK